MHLRMEFDSSVGPPCLLLFHEVPNLIPICLVPAQANIQISKPINQRSCCCCQVFNPRLTIVIDNWDQIREEISCSNVVQRESIIFASKLDKNLTEFAVEMDQEVIREYLRALSKGFQAKNFTNLWSMTARRAMVTRILDKWVKEYQEEAVVEKLVTALGVSGFMDVRLRVKKILEDSF